MIRIHFERKSPQTPNKKIEKMLITGIGPLNPEANSSNHRPVGNFDFCCCNFYIFHISITFLYFVTSTIQCDEKARGMFHRFENSDIKSGQPWLNRYNKIDIFGSVHVCVCLLCAVFMTLANTYYEHKH